MYRMLSFIAVLTCLYFTQCKKDNNKIVADNPYGLPNTTQSGANIFACRLNDNNWISKKGIYNMGGTVDNDTIYIRGTNQQTGVETIFLEIKGGLQEGATYNLNSNNKIIFTTTRLCNSDIVAFYSYQANTGQIKLSKFDKQKKILSGTFSFSLIRDNCGNDILEATDGRFDILYH